MIPQSIINGATIIGIGFTIYGISLYLEDKNYVAGKAFYYLGLVYALMGFLIMFIK